MKIFLKSLFLLVFVFLALNFGNQVFENRYYNVASIDELNDSFLIESEWIPEYFPQTARNLNVYVNTEESFLEIDFSLQATETHMFQNVCSIIEVYKNSAKYLCPSEFGYTSIIAVNQDGRAKFVRFYNGI